MGCDDHPVSGGVAPSVISIHAPIVGCDPSEYLTTVLVQRFQSTHPSWGATLNQNGQIEVYDISIHAPIVGCDKDLLKFFDDKINFNPRTHRGVRLGDNVLQFDADAFQSTHPSWGATNRSYILNLEITNFNPRTHRGVRLYAFMH